MNSYTQNYKRNYFINSGTFQHIFCIFIWYLILALPFYFSFGGQSNTFSYSEFWLKPKTSMINLTYNFTGYYAIQVNSLSSSASLQEEYSNIIQFSMNNLTISQWNVIDTLQTSQISFSLSNFDKKQIIDINIIMYYKVTFEDFQKQISASYIQHFAGDDSFTQAVSLLSYDPESPINIIDNKNILNYPAYFANLQSSNSFDNLIDFTIQNQNVHRFSQQTFKRSTLSKEDLTRNYKIKLVKDRLVGVPYYPSILQTLKFSFSTWLAFAIIAYFIFYSLLQKLLKDGSLISKIKDQIIN